MKLTPSLADADHAAAYYIFENQLKDNLIRHLKLELLLDQEGIDRVLPVLRSIYAFGFKNVSLSAEVSSTDPRATELQTEGSDLRKQINEMSHLMAETALHIYESNIFLVARYLASLDEQFYPRQRH